MAANITAAVAEFTNSLRPFANPDDPASAGPFLARIMSALEDDLPLNPDYEANRPDVVDWLDPALDIARGHSPEIGRVADAFATLAPHLCWASRPGGEDTSQKFLDNHANTIFVGHDGLAKHRDIRIGCSLVAPNIDYPEHRHAPEEAYLVLAGGDWKQHQGEWFPRRTGQMVHNLPMDWHAMRSGDQPLLAIWMLWVRD